MDHQPVFDIPNFERVTTDKLAHYYIVCQSAMYEMQRRHNTTHLTSLHETAEREWKADPININNPDTFPEKQ
jgi:predicted metal-dependent hydrolase